jgi:hypothetical protein
MRGVQAEKPRRKAGLLFSCDPSRLPPVVKALPLSTPLFTTIV